MIDIIKSEAIDLLLEGRMTKAAIARKCDRSRPWLYSILEDPEVVAEMDARLHGIQTFAQNRLKATLTERIDNIIKLSKTAESEKVRLDASIYLINRVMGNTTTKVDVTATTNQPDQVDFDKELDEIVIEE